MTHRIAAFLAAAALSATAPVVAADDGKVLYEQKCAICHGKDGVAKPAGQGSRSFNTPEFQKSSTVDAIAKVTSEGKGKMPPYRSKLSAEQIRLIAAHVKTLGS